MGQQKNRYLLTGGGTGGHVYPAIAIADELKRREPEAEFRYVGVRGKAEEKIAPRHGYEIEFVTSRGWPGARPSLSLLKFAVSLGWGIVKAMQILRRYQPTAIIATGGYVSAPIMLAWVILKRLKMTSARAFVHEQNMAPGRLNRLVGQMAQRVGLSFEESRRFLPEGEFVGYPVRQEVGQFTREDARKKLGIPADAKVLLAFGGSQGARTINRAVVDALPALLNDPKVWVLHGYGRYIGADYQAERDTSTRLNALGLSAEQKKRYQMSDYLDPIQEYYAASDVLVCRAGAGTVCELAICGLPAILIPKANLPGDHQVMNARALSDHGAAYVMYERTKRGEEGLIEYVEGKELAAKVTQALEAPEELQAIKEKVKAFADLNALGRIAERVQQLAADKLPPIPPFDRSKYKGPELSEMTGGALVSYLSRYGKDSLDAKDLEYVSYRADGYLASSSWKTRNVGVKLIGLLGLHERLDILLYILQDKTPAPTWQRWVGGDYMQVGFIRRNAVNVLCQLNLWNDEVRNVLLGCLADPYFEVRSAAARATIHFSKQIGQDQEFLAALKKCVAERNFEVVCAALKALAEFETRPEVYNLLHSFFLDSNWRIREAVTLAIKRLIERGVIPAERVAGDIDQLLLTSTGFVPRFPIREQIIALSQTVQEHKGKTDVSEAKEESQSSTAKQDAMPTQDKGTNTKSQSESPSPKDANGDSDGVTNGGEEPKKSLLSPQGTEYQKAKGRDAVKASEASKSLESSTETTLLDEAAKAEVGHVDASTITNQTEEVRRTPLEGAEVGNVDVSKVATQTSRSKESGEGEHKTGAWGEVAQAAQSQVAPDESGDKNADKPLPS